MLGDRDAPILLIAIGGTRSLNGEDLVRRLDAPSVPRRLSRALKHSRRLLHWGTSVGREALRGWNQWWTRFSGQVRMALVSMRIGAFATFMMNAFLLSASATLAGCAERPAPVASSATRHAESAPAKEPPAPSATPSTAAPREAKAPSRIETFLAPRADEVPAATSVPGTRPLAQDDQEALARCQSGPESRRCIDLANFNTRKRAIEVKDSNARQQMLMIARAIATAPSPCGSGARNPERGACTSVDPGITPIKWQREGWSCVEKAVPKSELRYLDHGVYSYAFTVDPSLGVYEVTAVGCLTLYNDGDGKTSVETTLILRGKLGESVVDESQIRRRARP